MRRGFPCAGAVLGAVALLFGGLPAASGAEGLAFGVFPRWSAQVTVRDFTPLAQVLGREIGTAVQLETDKDFSSFMARVHAREFDLVHLNQLQYLSAREAAGYRALARVCERGPCTIRALIVARRDARLAGLADLRGRTVAFGDPGAAVSYLLARSLLARAGVGPSDYRAIFTRNPPNALLAVYNGAADAAGVGSAIFERPEVRRHVDPARLQVLAESEPIPQLPVAARADLDHALVGRILETLVRLRALPGGEEALRRIGADRFEPAEDREYESLGTLLGKDDGGR